MMERVSRRKLPVSNLTARLGDPPSLVAGPSKALQAIGDMNIVSDGGTIDGIVMSAK